MKWRDLWKLSLLNLFSAPVRSMLTVLGIAIGAGAVLAVLALGDAGKEQVRGEMGRLGIDKVWVTAAQGSSLKLDDSQLLSQKMNTQTAETVYLMMQITSPNAQTEAAVVGCSPSYPVMTELTLADGRMLYPLEWEADSRSVLLGDSLAKLLQVRAGETVHLNGMPFDVCGVVKTSGSFSRTDLSCAAIVPLAAVERMTGGRVHEVMLNAQNDMQPEKMALLVRKTLMDERGLLAETLTLQVQMEAANSVVSVFVDVLKWVAFICVLVGGIGVMNILLVSVRERTREIGIMKSLGTTQGQICRLFLLEALLYAFIGGSLGMMMGMVLIAAAGWSIGLNASIAFADCAGVLICTLVVGLVFGVLPAAKAAALKCVEALVEE